MDKQQDTHAKRLRTIGQMMHEFADSERNSEPRDGDEVAAVGLDHHGDWLEANADIIDELLSDRNIANLVTIIHEQCCVIRVLARDVITVGAPESVDARLDFHDAVFRHSREKATENQGAADAVRVALQERTSRIIQAAKRGKRGISGYGSERKLA